MERAIGFAEHDIPFRIVPNAGESMDGEAPLGLLLVRKPVSSKAWILAPRSSYWWPALRRKRPRSGTTPTTIRIFDVGSRRLATKCKA